MESSSPPSPTSAPDPADPAAPPDAAAPASPRRGGPTRALTLLTLVVLAALTLPALQPDFYQADLSTGDGAVYLVCARSLLAGEGYSYLGGPFAIRPPGFSVLLLPVLATVGMELDVLRLYVGAFGVLAIALLFLYQERRLGLPLTAAVCVAVWLNPGFLRSLGQIMSDIPGLAAMLGCLVLERWTRERRGVLPHALLGVTIGLAAYVRSINVFVVPALLLGRTFAAVAPRAHHGAEERPRLRSIAVPRLVVPALAAFLVLLPWNLRNGAVTDEISPDHTLFSSYSVAMWHTDRSDPESPTITTDDFVRRVRTRTQDLLSVLGSRMMVRGDDPTHLALGVFGLLCWAVVLATRRGTGDFLTGGMVLVICAYFGFMNRLVLPVYVMVLPAVALVVAWVLGRVLGEARGRGVTAALVLGLAFADYRHEWGWSENRARAQVFQAACHEVEQHLDDRVLAADFGGHFSVVLDRPVYSLRWSLKRDGANGGVDFVERYGVGGVICDMGLESNLRLANRLARRGAEIVDRAGNYTLLRIPEPGD